MLRTYSDAYLTEPAPKDAQGVIRMDLPGVKPGDTKAFAFWIENDSNRMVQDLKVFSRNKNVVFRHPESIKPKEAIRVVMEVTIPPDQTEPFDCEMHIEAYEVVKNPRHFEGAPQLKEVGSP